MSSKSTTERRELLALLGLAGASLAWASAFIAGKVVLSEMTPLSAAAIRYLIAATILFPFAVRQRPHGVHLREFGPLSLMVACSGVLYPWLFLLALSKTSATNTSLLIALNPAVTVLLAPLVGERWVRSKLAGVALAFLGAATVITRGDVRTLSELSFHAGDLLALVAAVMWAMFNLASRRVVAHFAASFANCTVYLLGGVLLLLLAADEQPVQQLAHASGLVLFALFSMAVVASVAAGQFFLFGVRTIGVSRSVVFIYFVPVLTALCATLLLHEQLQLAHAVGGAAVLLGVYWASRTPGTDSKREQPVMAGNQVHVRTVEKPIPAS